MLSSEQLDLIVRMVQAGWVAKMRPRAVELLVEQLLGHIEALRDDVYDLSNQVFDAEQQSRLAECRGVEKGRDAFRKELERVNDRRCELAANLIFLHSRVPGHPPYADNEKAVRLVTGYIEQLQSRVVELEVRECCKCGHSQQHHHGKGSCFHDAGTCRCNSFEPEKTKDWPTLANS